jgi:hypothetical protein
LNQKRRKIPLPAWLKKFFSRENLWALLLALIILVLWIVTTSTAPLWIYQGF